MGGEETQGGASFREKVLLSALRNKLSKRDSLPSTPRIKSQAWEETAHLFVLFTQVFYWQLLKHFHLKIHPWLFCSWNFHKGRELHTIWSCMRGFTFPQPCLVLSVESCCITSTTLTVTSGAAHNTVLAPDTDTSTGATMEKSLERHFNVNNVGKGSWPEIRIR